MRNTDDRYIIKVASEESRFWEWRVDESEFARDGNFARLKALGFREYPSLRNFWRALEQVNAATGDELARTLQAMAAFEMPAELRPLTIERLKQLARAYMDDLHAYVNVDVHIDNLLQSNTRFGVEVRKFRKRNQWLAQHFGPNDVFSVRSPAEHAAIFFGLRTSPDGALQLLFVGNLQGVESALKMQEFDLPTLSTPGWECAFTTPGYGIGPRFDEAFTLRNAEALIFHRDLSAVRVTM